jgi:hypothetical protein
MQLQLAQELPVRVQCPGCGAQFVVGGPAPAPAPAPAHALRKGAAAAALAPVGVRATPPPAAPASEPLIERQRPQGQTRLLPWLLIGGGVLAAGAAVVVVLLLRGGDKPQGDDALASAPPPKRIDPRQQKINDAIAKGVDYLTEQILSGNKVYYVTDRGGGSKVGVMALAGLTLLECTEGAGRGSKAREALDHAVATVRREGPQLRFTYSLALCILFLDRLYEAEGKKANPADRTLIQHLATQMIASQNRSGGWDYYCDPIPEGRHKQILDDLNAGRAVAKREHEKDDNSINQFCTLALWAARKHGIKTDAILQAIDDRYRKTQNDDGSWGYRARDKGFLRDATTCAGLIGLAVGQGVKKDQEQAKKGDKKAPPQDVTQTDPAIKKALAYITVSAPTPALSRTPKRLTDRERKVRHKHTQDMMELYKEWQEADAERQPQLMVQLQKLDDARQLKGTYIGADSWGDLYFLWSVERVGVVFDLKTINGKDWYNWGADIIMQFQRPDGSWNDRFPGICDTCFALLFLKRVNIAKDLTNKLRGELGGAGVSAAPPPRRPVPPPPLRRPRDA